MPIGIDPAIDRNTGARAPGNASSARYRRAIAQGAITRFGVSPGGRNPQVPVDGV